MMVVRMAASARTEDGLLFLARARSAFPAAGLVRLFRPPGTLGSALLRLALRLSPHILPPAGAGMKAAGGGFPPALAGGRVPGS